MATFTSTDEIIRMLGEDGYNAYISDLPGTDKTTFLSDVIAYATSEIATYTQEQYLDDQISSDKQVRMNATVIACHFISERRGNASLWEARIERIYEWLDKLRTGQIHLPSEEVQAPDVPVVRNYAVNFNSRHRILVDKEISTGSHDDEHTIPDDIYYVP